MQIGARSLPLKPSLENSLDDASLTHTPWLEASTLDKNIWTTSQKQLV